MARAAFSRSVRIYATVPVRKPERGFRFRYRRGRIVGQLTMQLTVARGHDRADQHWRVGDVTLTQHIRETASLCIAITATTPDTALRSKCV